MCDTLEKRPAIRKWQLFSLAIAFCLLVSQLSAQNLNAKSELSRGIAAFDKATYGVAIIYLERAVALDPQSVTGHFYLAEAYDKTSAEECEWNCAANERRRQRAIEEYSRALELEPSLVEAMKAIAWRYQRSAKLDDADRYYRKALAIDSNDFEALYNLAVIGWARSYQLRQMKRAELKLRPKTPLIHSPACQEVRSENLSRVEESIALLDRANTILEFHDAQVYLNLLYRERADIQCDDQSSYDQDINTGAEWARHACETRNSYYGAIRGISLARLQTDPPPPPRGDMGACPN